MQRHNTVTEIVSVYLSFLNMLALVRTSVLAFIASQPRNTLISLRSKSCAPLSATKYLLRYDYVSVRCSSINSYFISCITSNAFSRSTIL